jgi:hypothetical protein
MFIQVNPNKKESILYFTESNAHRVRMFNTTSKTVNSIIGYNATIALRKVISFNYPYDVWVNSVGTIFVLDRTGDFIRAISPVDQTMSLYGGTASGALTTNKVLATSTNIGNPYVICGDTMGNVYLGGEPNGRIRRIGTDGYITWVAGDGKTDYAFNGDEISPYSARLGQMQGCFVDTNGVLYFSQFNLGRIRKIELYQPTSMPSMQPSRQPSSQPTRQPVGVPTGQPTRQPTRQPTGQPSHQPTSQPSRQPITSPTGQPSCQPTSQPTR